MQQLNEAATKYVEKQLTWEHVMHLTNIVWKKQNWDTSSSVKYECVDL